MFKYDKMKRLKDLPHKLPRKFFILKGLEKVPNP